MLFHKSVLVYTQHNELQRYRYVSDLYATIFLAYSAALTVLGISCIPMCLTCHGIGENDVDPEHDKKKSNNKISSKSDPQLEIENSSSKTDWHHDFLSGP